VVAIFAGSVTANLTTNYRMPITFHDLLFNWIFGYSRYAEWYVFSHKVTENIYFKRTQKYLFVAYLFLPLFIYVYFHYSPGLVPKSTSQNEEDTEESKAREQEQQRRRM